MFNVQPYVHLVVFFHENICLCLDIVEFMKSMFCSDTSPVMNSSNRPFIIMMSNAGSLMLHHQRANQTSSNVRFSAFEVVMKKSIASAMFFQDDLHMVIRKQLSSSSVKYVTVLQYSFFELIQDRQLIILDKKGLP